MSDRQLSAVSRFRELHASGCFVMPNPWDPGSAILLARLGFPALATTSAGFAFSRGLPDDVDALSRDVVLAHVRELAQATPLPLNADFQNGYADDPAGVDANVTRCIATGTAGLSIEDSTGDAASIARAALGAFLRAARELAEDGSFEGLANAVTFPELNAAFRRERA